MQRPTKKFKTESGVEVEMKTYITFGESRKIQSVYLENVEMGVNAEGKPEMSGMKGDVAEKAQNVAIELLIVSVDGEKENIVDKILSLPKLDGEQVIAELDAVQSGMSEEKKTK